jgi:hypothetical protein
VIHAVRVAVCATGAEAESVLQKMEAALDLVLQHDRRAMQVLREQSEGIFVFGTAGVCAEWHRQEKLVVLQPEYVSAPATSIVRLASTLVHEATHAWLEKLGFVYSQERRQRIEAICLKRELRFVRQAGSGNELISELERQLICDPAYFSPEAFRERTLTEIERLGVSRRVVSIIEKCVKQWRRLTRGLKPMPKTLALWLALFVTGLAA